LTEEDLGSLSRPGTRGSLLREEDMIIPPSSLGPWGGLAGRAPGVPFPRRPRRGFTAVGPVIPLFSWDRDGSCHWASVVPCCPTPPFVSSGDRKIVSSLGIILSKIAGCFSLSNNIKIDRNEPDAWREQGCSLTSIPTGENPVPPVPGISQTIPLETKGSLYGRCRALPFIIPGNNHELRS
jgi:hypothetical protein